MARQELRQGGAVDPDRLREAGARLAGAVDEHLQALAKDRTELTLIHALSPLSHMRIIC